MHEIIQQDWMNKRSYLTWWWLEFNVRIIKSTWTCPIFQPVTTSIPSRANPLSLNVNKISSSRFFEKTLEKSLNKTLRRGIRVESHGEWKTSRFDPPPRQSPFRGKTCFIYSIECDNRPPITWCVSSNSSLCKTFNEAAYFIAIFYIHWYKLIQALQFQFWIKFIRF